MGTVSWLVPVLVAAAYVAFGAASVVLTIIDLRVRRLPDAIVLPTFAVVLILLTCVTIITGEFGSLIRALLGAASLLAFYLVISLVSRGGMGAGDVKLAAVIGLVTAWIGWPALIVATVGAFLLGGAFGLVLLASRRVGRRAAVPFGPWMLGSAWIGIFAGPLIWGWYASVIGIPVAA